MSDPLHYSYSKQHPRETLDPSTRLRKARKVHAVLVEEIGSDRLARSTALDIGCSGGIVTAYLADFVHSIEGTDVDSDAIAFARRAHAEKIRSGKLSFELASSTKLVRRDDSIDLIVCNMIYEHVDDPERLVSEMHRVLRQDGVIYFGASNRLSVIEPHERLPFLSWMPKSWSNRYLRAVGRGHAYRENLRTLLGLRQLLARFTVADYTLRILRAPEQFHALDAVPAGLSRIPRPLLRLAYPFIPTYIWILRKT